MTRFERMEQACKEKKRRTEGKCEEWECIGVGWCDDCLKAAEKEPKEEGK